MAETLADDATFIKFNLPPDSCAALNRNGTNLTLDDIITQTLALPEVGSVKELALYVLYGILEGSTAEGSLGMMSERLGQYSYKRWKMKGSQYWWERAKSSSVANERNYPRVVHDRCRQHYPFGGFW